MLGAIGARESPSLCSGHSSCSQVCLPVQWGEGSLNLHADLDVQRQLLQEFKRQDNIVDRLWGTSMSST